MSLTSFSTTGFGLLLGAGSGLFAGARLVVVAVVVLFPLLLLRIGRRRLAARQRPRRRAANGEGDGRRLRGQRGGPGRAPIRAAAKKQQHR